VTATVTVANDGVATASDLAIGVTAPAGWSVTPASPPTSTTLRSTNSASQTFTLTAGTPSGPLQAGQVSATAQFTWDGRAASVSASVPVTTATAVQAPYQTYSSATDATAAYGQAGEQFGIEGAGTDLYSGTDDYSTIYQSGVAGTDSTIQTEVTSQQDMAGFAKAGIIVRNDMTASGSAPEGVILYESPSGGIQLEWDDNGGPWIDNVTPDNGTIPDSLPVYLKLTRDGSTYTGYYSTDGSTWQTVGSVSVPDQASTQDAGMFVTSHAAGSLGEVLFNGFSVS
jgi:alpha-galactosidase